MYSGASNLADGVDRAFVFIFATAFIFIIGITVFMIWTVIKFNRKKGNPAKQFTGSIKLEVLWTVIPTILVLIMFYYGWKGFAPMRKVPKDAMEINAIGRMWEWEFDYGDGKMSKDLVIPLGKAVKLNLVSEDVNHSLFIPAFRVKEDVVPGYNNYLWFIAEQKGEYEILCTEYCGLLHSGMVAKAKVVAPENFNLWLSEVISKKDMPDPVGLTLLKDKGCLACHSLDGSKLVGPSFKGVYNAEKIVIGQDGKEKKVVADDQYLRESVYDPNAEVVKGYNKGLMQSYTGTVSDEELKDIIEYLKTLK